MLSRLTAEPVPLSTAVPVRVQKVRRDSRADAPPRFAHFHAAAELVIFGAVAGALVTEDKTYDLAPGCMTWAPSMAVHDFAIQAGSADWVLIQYYQDFATVVPGDEPVCITLGPQEQGRVRALADWLQHAVEAGAAEEARRYLELLLLLMARGASQPFSGSARGQALARFRPLLERMRAAPGAKLSLDEAASLCNLSSTYLSRLFPAVFGCSFSEYVTQMRLEQAAMALASSAAPVSAIGYSVGFTSHAYFSARFRARFGTTPSGFRRRALDAQPQRARTAPEA